MYHTNGMKELIRGGKVDGAFGLEKEGK